MSSLQTPERSLVKRVLASVLVALVLVTCGAGLFFADAVRRYATRETEARLRSIAIDLLAGLSFDADGVPAVNRLPEAEAFEDRFSGWYWQITIDDAAVIRSRSLLVADLSVPAPGDSVIAGPEGEKLRAVSLARAVGTPPRRAMVVVAAPQREIDDLVSSDLRLLVLGLSMLLTMLLLMTGLLLYRGLSPLGQMRENLRAMLSGETRRLDQTGFRELDALVVLINRLVDESRRLVAANRETASKLAHALKTPLALIAARTDAAGSAPDPDMHASVVLMRRHIEHHLKKVQVAGAPRGLASSIPVEPIVKDLLFAFAHTFRERHLSQTVDVEPGASFFGERDDLIELMGNLLDNAHRFARSRVRVSARCIGQDLLLTIADDGPGLPAPRMSSQEATSSSPDASTREPPKGLGLVITNEIVKTYGGLLSFSPSGNGAGLTVEVTLPCR